MVNMFYDRWGQSGLIDGYWNLEVKTVQLEPGIEYDYLMKKVVTERLNLHQKCATEHNLKDKRYNYHECLDNYTQLQLQKRLREKSQKLCWIPQADYFIRLMNVTDIEACQTTKEMEAVSHELRSIMSNADSDNKMCPQPCTSAHLTFKEVDIMINKADKNNISEMYFQWEDDTVIIQEEYLLMDFNAIVAAVGGSLGLFLGFSWLQTLLQVIQKVQNKISGLK